MKTVAATIQDCRRVYRDILRGYSVASYPHTLYVKHLTESDYGDIEDRGESLKLKAESYGLLSEENTLKVLDEHGHWSNEEESNFQSIASSLRDLEKQRKKITTKEQFDQISAIITQQESELRVLSLERNSLLFTSVDNYVARKIQEEYIKCSFYRDPELKLPYYTTEEFNILTNSQMGDLFFVYNHICGVFSERNLCKIACCAFFLNSLNLSDKMVDFYGKPICNLSTYQVNLAHNGLRYKAVLNDGAEPPEYEDLDKLVNWYDAQYSILLSKDQDARKKAK